MVIRTTDAELEIRGSQHELDALADRIVSVRAEAEVAQAAEAEADARPYDRCLTQLKVRVTKGPVRVAVVDDELVVTGSAETLGAFASFFRFDAADRPGTHNHYEWFDGNEHIAADSRPLVISVG